MEPLALSYLLLLYAGWGSGSMRNPSIMLQCHNKNLYSLLHQLLPVVREEQVVVRDAVAHWIIGAHHVQQRGEQRQCVSGDKDVRTVFASHVHVCVEQLNTDYNYM